MMTSMYWGSLVPVVMPCVCVAPLPLLFVFIDAAAWALPDVKVTPPDPPVDQVEYVVWKCAGI